MNKRPVSHFSRRAHQAGLSLVELLVAVAIGLLLLTAVLTLYASMSSATKTSTQEAQLNEDGALALQILKQQLQLAGYSGIQTLVDGAPNFTGISVLGCDGGFDNKTDNYMSSLTGAAVTPKCGSTNTKPDAISVRFQADMQNSVAISETTNKKNLDGTTATNPDGSVVTETNSYPSNCAYEKIGNWKNSTYALAENRFYVADDTANNNTPTLFCNGITSQADGTAPAFGVASALIPNVEDLQLNYVVTPALTAGATTYLPQVSGIAEAKDGILGTTLTNWGRVAGVQICILMRSNEPVPLGGLSKGDVGYYRKCDGTTVTNSTDRYLRRAFHTTVAFRNLRPDIAKPYDAKKCPWTEAQCTAGASAASTTLGG